MNKKCTPLIYRHFVLAISLSSTLIVVSACSPPPTPPLPTSTSTLTPTETPDPRIGTTLTSDVDGMELVFVPAGEFVMGRDLLLDDEVPWTEDEDPAHTVYLDDYWIDKYEVTRFQFTLFLNENGNQVEHGLTWLFEPSEVIDIAVESGSEEASWIVLNDMGSHPVIGANWYGAAAYCEWAGRRLPTEAEWEKAARGTDNRYYPWGQGIDCSLAQYEACGDETRPVGSFRNGASPFGALDMAGNVWEWVADWHDYGGDYYSQSPYSNPQGASDPPPSEVAIYKLLRGGSWGSYNSTVRVSTRDFTNPLVNQVSDIGFRCALTP